MNPDASLADLRDIAVPEPPPFWPPALGVWVLATVALGLLIAVVILVWRRWEDNAYRRAGLALLKTARSVRDVNIVLKRVALVAYPRSVVAPLWGEEWAAFLDGACRRTKFAGLDAPGDDDEASRQLRSLAQTWIRYHREPKGS